MMQNTKIVFGLLAAIVVAAYTGCQCPQCPPQQENNIVIDDVDTARFMIVTDDVDTAFIAMPVPRVKKLDSLFRYSIVIDDVDTARMKIVTDDTDAAKMVDIVVKPKLKPTRPNNPKQQRK
jgi:hypothetical protein